MPTKFYLPDSGTAAISPNVSALWGQNPSLVRAPLTRTKTNTALADESSATYVETVTSTGNLVHRQFISEPLPFAQTVSGTFKLVVRCAENDAAADNQLQVHIRVLSGDGTTSRGNLYSGQSATLNSTAGALGQEMATTLTTRIFNAVSLSSVSASAGDRICVEIGHRYMNTSSTSCGSFMTWGDPTGGTDHTLVATETSQLTPWIEFSQNLFQVATTRTVSFDTLATVAPTRTVTWDTLARITKVRTASWDVAAPTTAVSTDRTVSWDVLARISKARTISFDVLAGVTPISRTVSFDTLARISKARTVSWDVAAPTTPLAVDRTVSWDVLSRVSKARTVSWDVRAQVTPISRTVSFDTLARVSKARTVSWDVLEVTTPVATSRTVSWDVLSRTTKVRTVSWDVRARVTAARTVTFDTLLRITKVRTVSWDVDESLPPVTVSRTVLFDVEILPPPPIIPPIFRVPAPILPTTYVVVVRNQGLQRVGAVNVKALQFTPRYNDVGDWTITVSGEDANAAKLFAPGAGVMIYHGDNMSVPLMTGPVGSRTRTLTERGGYEFTISGPDDMVWLNMRAPYQMPSREADSQGTPSLGALAHDIRSGAAETVIKGYVEANVGQTALVGRRRLTVTPAGGSPRGVTVTGKARMLPTLLELIRGKAATGGIGFKVVQSAGAVLPFDVFVPTNRTASVRFSTELRNLVEFSYTETAPSASYVIAGGQGDLTARTFRVMTDDAALVKWPDWRFEKYIDQRQAEDNDDLDQALAEELISGGPTTNLAISTRDTEQIRFGVHYYVGDKVTVELPEFNGTVETVQDIIREATVSWSPDEGPQVVTRVGSAEITGTDPIAQRLRKLRKQTDDGNTVD